MITVNRIDDIIEDNFESTYGRVDRGLIYKSPTRMFTIIETHGLYGAPSNALYFIKTENGNLLWRDGTVHPCTGYKDSVSILTAPGWFPSLVEVRVTLSYIERTINKLVHQ